MTEYSRRDVLRAGAAGVAAGALTPLLSACGSASTSSSSQVAKKAALAPVSFQLSWIPGNEWAGTYIAQERGYYEDEGIDLTVLPGGPNVTVEPLIATNKVLVGMTYGLGTATTDINGANIKIFATQYQRPPDVIVSLPKKPIRTLADLTGKTIGVPSDGMPVWTQFLHNNHIDASEIHVVPVQTSLDPLTNGQVDGIQTYSTETAQLNTAGFTPVFLFLSDYGYSDISNGYGASQANIEKNGDLIARFMRAEVRGWQDFIKDPAYGAHLTVTKYAKGAGLGLKETTIECEQTAGLMTYGTVYREKGLFWLSPELQNSVLANLNSALKKPVTAAQIFDDTVMPKVYGGATRIV